MTALLLIDLTELALPQPRVSRRAPSAASVRRRKAAKPLSFATSLQRARTPSTIYSTVRADGSGSR